MTYLDMIWGGVNYQQKLFFLKVNYSFNNGNFLAHLLMWLHLNSNLTILSVTIISCPLFLLHL